MSERPTKIAILVLFGAACAYLLYRWGKRPQLADSVENGGAEPVRQLDKDGWDSVDQASWESFPASDPPAY